MQHFAIARQYMAKNHHFVALLFWALLYCKKKKKKKKSKVQYSCSINKDTHIPCNKLFTEFSLDKN